MKDVNGIVMRNLTLRLTW